MKITYFKAKNFADIYSGLKRHMIEIDFSKSKNRIILLVGENGTGKTAIMSKLHPFAYPGNMDVRNGVEMILEGEDGYKEIHFQHNENTFVIKHHYLYKSGKGLKSFIAKNDVELNPNGNIGSFKELVYLHLGLEQDFMKLLRLGSNVTGVIDMKATERKNFASNLLSDIDIYSKFYRKISDDSRLAKATLRSIAEKIDKLHIYDEKDEVAKMSELEEQLKKLQKIRDEINNEIGKHEATIQLLVSDGIDTFISNLRSKEMEHAQLLKEIESVHSKMKKLKLIMVGPIEDEIKRMEDTIRTYEGEMTTNKTMMDFYFNQLNNLHTQKEEKTNSLKYISSELEYSRLTDLLLELQREKEKLDAKFKDFAPKCTREDMLTILGLFQEIDKFVADIHEMDETAVRNVINHILKNENVDAIVRREVTKIDDRMAKINADIQRMNESAGVNPNAVYVLCIPEHSTCECPFKRFYEDIMGGKKDSPREKLVTEQKMLEHRRERFLTYQEVSKKIDYILMIIKTNKALVDRSPENFFDIPKILQSIRDYIPFYDEEYITRYISILEEYESYLELDKKIKEVHREKSFIEKNSSTLVSVQKELEALDREIHRLNEELTALRFRNKLLEETLGAMSVRLNDLKEYQLYQQELENIQREASAIRTEVEGMYSIRERVNEARGLYNTEVARRNSIIQEIKKLEEAIQTIRFRLMEFASLQKEKAELEERFDEIEIIKESLSSTKGIPLLFIQLYMKNARGMINNLLETVYKGELEVDEFEINDKEFRIPYIKNGVVVRDAEYCSQGERSFISLALSFALAEQSIETYNIMLLDEIDATLDTKKRAMFITILEKQLDAIGSEQVFMITHNNMFDNYPVDVIMTSDVNIDNYRNTNIIFKAA